MANFDFDFPEDIFGGIENIFDEAAPKMIDAALPIYKDSVETSLKQSISTAPEDAKRQTGELVDSVKQKKAKRTKTDAYIGTITFEGVDSKGSPNMVKALGLEYGTSRGQVARPFLQRAKESCEKEAVDTMQEIFNREVNGS